ncbi:hypothetical protein G6011_05620 [Alternaria panax]|uniref:Uncharacterized protein n=1 Tax=Alternaria panax TaxID=48097 RepID=A0AAD4FC59_9PLEO|nr:hypothetical protein G6011_05620 [Alternaria panax]
MADISAELASELTRIIDCPYPPSLSNLSDLLARADVPTIRSCVQDRSPCAVNRLANIVFDALPLNAYTLRVLHLLCHAPEFRDELLVLQPTLLHSLLKKANSSKSNFEQHAELCVLLLSRTLPEAILLPAVAQTFFLNVFENATQQPNYDTLRSVYRMLNGACRQLYSLLPRDLQQRFDTELCNILRSKRVVQSSMLFLWAEGIVLITEHPDGIESLQGLPTDEEPASTERLRQHWATPSGQKLFGSTKDSHKTIELTCLNVVWVLRGGIKDEEAVEGIRIASRALQSISQDVKDNWPRSSNSAATLYSKCFSKVQSSGASMPVQLEALSFLGILSSSQGLSQDVVARYEACILEAPRVAEPESYAELLAVSLPTYAAQIKEGTVIALLSGILAACASQPGCWEASNLIDIIDELAATTMTSSILRTTVLRALSSRTLHEKLAEIAHSIAIKERTSCCTYAASMRRRLTAATIASILTITLTTQPGESAIPHTIVTALIKKQRNLPPVLNACLHSTESLNLPSISLFQEASTQHTGQHLEDWKKRLDSELESQNKYQRDAVMRSMAQICSDLETRCNTVEEPLRLEKEKLIKLQERTAHLEEQIESLQQERQDYIDHADGLDKDLQDLKDEQRHLVQQKSALAKEMEEVYSRLKEVETCLEVSEQNATKALNAAHERSSAVESELRSTMLKYEGVIGARNEEIHELRLTIDQLRESEVQHKEDYEDLVTQCEQFQNRGHEAEGLLEQERMNACRQSDDIARLEAQVTEHQRRLEEKEAELEDTLRQLHVLRASYHELEETSAGTTRELVAKHASDLETFTRRAEDEHKELEIQLQNAQNSAQQERYNHEKTRSDVEHLQASIPPLEARIQELEEFCKEQEEELEGFRTAQKMMAMHLRPARPASRTYKEIAQPQTVREPRTHRRRKSTMNAQEGMLKAQTDTQGLLDKATENFTNASFASSADSNSSQGGGPTPKRARPRSTFKVPTMQTPYTQKPDMISKSVSRSHNASSSKRALEQTEFDIDDDFTTGTPLTPGFMSGTGRMPVEDDETVTEI